MANDVIAAIVAEMRTRSREVKGAAGGTPDGVENMLDIWADRIEAAHNREIRWWQDAAKDNLEIADNFKRLLDKALDAMMFASHKAKNKKGNGAA